jgi:hypothetical protein
LLLRAFSYFSLFRGSGFRVFAFAHRLAHVARKPTGMMVAARTQQAMSLTAVRTAAVATVQGVGAPELGSSTNPVGSLDRAFQLARARDVAGRPVSQFILATGNYTLPRAIVFDSAPAGTALVGGWAWHTTTRR